VEDVAPGQHLPWSTALLQTGRRGIAVGDVHQPGGSPIQLSAAPTRSAAPRPEADGRRGPLGAARRGR
jgi:hypothetical protein